MARWRCFRPDGAGLPSLEADPPYRSQQPAANRGQQPADKIGIDAPFGWSVPFVRAVAQYSASTAWPSAEVRELRFRRTDKVVREKLGRWPLSVSSDLIGVTAMRAVRLLAETAARGATIDRSGGGRFVEVYPAAALSVWEFPSRGYKGTKGSAVRARLVSDLAERPADWLALSRND